MDSSAKKICAANETTRLIFPPGKVRKAFKRGRHASRVRRNAYYVMTGVLQYLAEDIIREVTEHKTAKLHFGPDKKTQKFNYDSRDLKLTLSRDYDLNQTFFNWGHADIGGAGVVPCIPQELEKRFGPRPAKRVVEKQ